MAVRPIRRIGVSAGARLHDQIAASLLQSPYGPTSTNAIETAHPDLIVRDGANVVAAFARGSTAHLVYGFENERAFADRFPAMFEKLLPKARRALGAKEARLRLSYAPGRPLIEPVLKRLSFAPVRDWIEFALERGGRLPAASPRGVTYRAGSATDIDDLLRIDRHAFPDTPMERDGMLARLRGEDAIIAMAGGTAAGFCLFSMPEPDEGYIHVVAVDDAHRRRGIGAALTLRACRRLFAAGARRVALTTDDANGAAIRLYVRLGFRQLRAGRDYARPTDPRAIARAKQRGQGTLIRFGGWR